jgi:trehalose 6-phosphate synthase
MLTHLNPAQKTSTASPDESERLIVVSNRGPVEHCFSEGGRIQRREAGGGVATALASVARSAPVTWLASPGTNADRVLAIAGREVPLARDSSLKFVNVPEESYRLFYEVFCNPILWFLQHQLQSHLERHTQGRDTWRAWELGYRRVNELYADAILSELDAARGDRVMLNDYHFYLTPRMVRARRPDVTLQHFIHIPWPAPHVWSELPHHMVAAICRGLLGNDSLVFQTDDSVARFLSTCAIYLKDEATVSTAPGEVRHGGRVTSVWSNPISVDNRALIEEASGVKAEPYTAAFNGHSGLKTIVRVDRLDPSKNVVEGFLAYEHLLREHPEWYGKIRFLAFLVPSRTSIPEYKTYQDQTFAVINAINRRYGKSDWQPIEVFHEHNRTQALVALRGYDVLLVNPVLDGMNLVSKEGPVLNETDGVLVLSEAAGSFEELRCGALPVTPGDVAGTAAALNLALRMPADERRYRASLLKECIDRHQIQDWLRMQLKDLAITEYVKALSPVASRR